MAALQNALADAYAQAAAPGPARRACGRRVPTATACAAWPWRSARPQTSAACCTLAPGGQGLAYALAAPDGTDARALGRALNEAFAGRGGGKPAFCQGSLAQPGLTPDVVREKLSTLL